jgi:hypothetical protein
MSQCEKIPMEDGVLVIESLSSSFHRHRCDYVWYRIALEAKSKIKPLLRELTGRNYCCSASTWRRGQAGGVT